MDVTERKRRRCCWAERNGLLEMIARGDARSLILDSYRSSTNWPSVSSLILLVGPKATGFGTAQRLEPANKIH